MKMSDAFPSKWITAAELDDQDCVVTISEVKLESLEIPGQPMVDKPVVYFKESDKGLVLNKTNGKAIAALYGNDTDDWEGKKITLYPTEVNFQGTMTPCVRVRSKPPKTPKPIGNGLTAKTLTPAQPKPLVPAVGDAADEDIPF